MVAHIFPSFMQTVLEDVDCSGGGTGGEGGRGHSPPAALSRGRHFEGRKYGILKIGRFWQIDVCIAERVGS